jgi:hypothetical protein
MSYRFNVIDIIVGVGMSAIMFGALLLFVATTGTFDATFSQSVASDVFFDDPTGMVWLQPVLGQAIVDRLVTERRINATKADAVSQWNRATMAYHDLQSSFGPFGTVRQMAVAVPAEHMARVQSVMGRSVVNFTRRGIQSGLLSAQQGGSPYNRAMIGKTEAMGDKLDEAFASTWQATLGRAVVEAAQRYSERTNAVQQQLGSAIVHLTHAQVLAADEEASNQQQLAGAIMAAIRTNALSDRLQLLAALESMPEETMVRSTKPATWPDVPIGLLIAALLGLGAVFFAGMLISAMGREARAQAERARDLSRWVYRTAA